MYVDTLLPLGKLDPGLREPDTPRHVGDFAAGARQASRFAKEQRWDRLPELVGDDMLHTVATIGTHDTIAAQLIERCADRVDRIEFSIPIRTPEDADVYIGILAELKAAS